MTDIEKNIKSIRNNIDGKTLLVAVTKTRTPEEINEAIAAGISDIGENKVQEIVDKYDQVNNVRWHMIGHLQTNKVKYIIDKVCMIHSVDSLKLAKEINKRAVQNDIIMDVLIQVNIALEESKFGVPSEDIESLLKDIANNCTSIALKGLMFIAPYEDNPNDVRIYFKKAKELYDKYSSKYKFQYLSMGMSHDYKVALEEGSNLIRVGSSIFGDRDYSK